MSTGMQKVNIFLKKFLPQQQITENFMEYLRTLIYNVMGDTFPEEGFLQGGVLSSGGSDKFTISTSLVATDGLGHRLKPDPVNVTQVPFQNSLGINYYVGLRYKEIPAGVEVNVRIQQLEYTFYEETIGELAQPNSVIDNGATMTFIVDSVTEAGVSNAGRKVKVWMKTRPVGEADAFFTGTVVWDGTNNKITTTHLLGQDVGDVSTNAADYEVFLIGPTVKRNTNLDNDPAVAFVGIVVGAGAGNAPTTFDQSGQNLIAPSSVTTIVNNEVKSYLTGGGLVSWDLDSQTLTWADALKILIPHQSFNFTINAGSVSSLANGQCVYFTMDTIGGVKTLTKVNTGSVPNDANNYVVALRYGNDIYFKNSALELKGITGEDTSGRINDITQDLLDFIGATDESDGDPNYTSIVGDADDVLTQGESLKDGIDALHTSVRAINTNNPGENIFIGDGSTTVFTLSTFTVDPDNTVYDLEVFIDGRRNGIASDGIFNQDYKNFRKVSTTQVELAVAPPIGKVVTLYKQGTSYGGPTAPTSGNLWSDPMDASIVPNVDAFHDIGSSIRRVREVHVQTLYANSVVHRTPFGDIKDIKSMVNNSGAAIAAGKPIAQTSTGIKLADSDAVAQKKYVGFTVQAIPDGDEGLVLLGGKNLPGVLTGLGFAPGDDIYIDETAGALTNNIATFSGFDDDITRIGIADSAEGTVTALATDLIMITDVVSRT